MKRTISEENDEQEQFYFFSSELEIFHIGRFWNRLLLTFVESIAVSIHMILVGNQASSLKAERTDGRNQRKVTRRIKEIKTQIT